MLIKTNWCSRITNLLRPFLIWSSVDEWAGDNCNSIVLFIFFLDKTSCQYLNGKCDENAECTKNSSGVISCTCFKGYNGDGYNCSSPCVNDNGGCHDNATCSYSVSIAICPFIAC